MTGIDNKENNKVFILSYSLSPNTEYIAKNNWRVYIFYITPSIYIQTFTELCDIWYDNIDDSVIKIPEPIEGRLETMLAGVEYCLIY